MSFFNSSSTWGNQKRNAGALSLSLVLCLGANGWSQGSGTSTAESAPPASATATTGTASTSASNGSPAAGWPDVSQKAAKAMTEKYGPPAEATDTMLVWHDNGPWKRTIVYKEPVEHHFPKPHKDVLEQFVSYKADPDKFSEIAKFDGSVIVERTKGVMSARCDKEPMNFLALNLAHEVATGKKSSDEARKEFTKQAMAFMQDESAPYTEKLIFEPQENAGDMGTPAPEMKSGGSDN